MKTTTVTKLKASLSEYLRQVKAGGGSFSHRARATHRQAYADC